MPSGAAEPNIFDPFVMGSPVCRAWELIANGGWCLAGIGKTFNLTGQWSYRDSPVRSHTLRGRPFLDLRLKPEKVCSPSPASS